MLRQKIFFHPRGKGSRGMASLITHGTTFKSPTTRKALSQKQSSSLFRCKSTIPPRVPLQEEARSLKQLMNTLNTALTAPQIIHHNILQKGLTAGIEKSHFPMHITSTTKTPQTIIIAPPQSSPIPLMAEESSSMPLVNNIDHNEQIEENLPRSMQQTVSAGRTIMQKKQEEEEETLLNEDQSQKEAVKSMPGKKQDDEKLLRELLHQCRSQGDSKGLISKIRSCKSQFKTGAIDPSLLQNAFHVLTQTNPFHAQEVLLMVRREQLGYDENLHVMGLRKLCSVYGEKKFVFSRPGNFHVVGKKIKTFIDEILSLPSDKVVQSLMGGDLLPCLMKSRLQSIHRFAHPLYHHYMNSERGRLSAAQLENLLRTFRYSPTTKQPPPKPIDGKVPPRYQQQSQNSLNLSVYAAILQDYVHAVLELSPDDNSVNPRHALDLISKTFPFLDHTNLIYQMLQMLRPLFSDDLLLDRGTLEHLMAAAAKRNHQALGSLIWDLYDLWSYTPSESCFECMIILLLKEGLTNNNRSEFYDTDYDIDTVDCFTQMIDAGYAPQQSFLRSMGRKLRHSELRSKAWIRLLKVHRCYQTTDAFNVMLAAQAAQGHLGVGLKILDDLNNFNGIEPNKESYGFIMEALATKIQMIVNKAEKQEKLMLENTIEQNEGGARSDVLSNDDAANTIGNHFNNTAEEFAHKKGYWFSVADRLLDEMEEKYNIPIDHFTFHHYVRFLALVGELELALASAQDAHDGNSVDVREKTWILLLNAHLFVGEYDTARKEILPYLKEDPELYRDRIERWTQHQHRDRPRHTNYVVNTKRKSDSKIIFN